MALNIIDDPVARANRNNTNYGAYAGLIAQLGGGLMDYYGQVQGAKALEAEAMRQAAEQEGFTNERHQRFTTELTRYDPATRQAMAQGGFMRADRAARPALAAGGKALGLGAGAVSAVGRSMLPTQRLAAQQGGQSTEAMRRAEETRRLQSDLEASQNRQSAASALYPMQSQVAGNKGAAWRMGGQMLGSVGMPLMAYSMAQK